MANLTDGLGLFIYRLESNIFHPVISFRFIEEEFVRLTGLGNEPYFGLRKNKELKLMQQRLTLVVEGLQSSSSVPDRGSEVRLPWP